MPATIRRIELPNTCSATAWPVQFSAGGSASTSCISAIDTSSGTKPITTMRCATGRPCNSAVALTTTIASRNANTPPGTASVPTPAIGPSLISLKPSTPATTSRPP